jgi:hypothetical protein
MYDDRDLISRSQKCLTCHLGTSEKFVDHQMIAAGHPDLYFELASFSAVMPKHWQERRDSAGKEDPWFDVRALFVGQAVQLREQLRRVARNAQGPNWPEYSELDCFACHHSLTAAKDSWRQELGYANRRPGNPPWNLSRYVVLAIIEDDRSGAPTLSQEIDRLYRLVSTPSSDRDQIASRASSAAALADRLVQQMTSVPVDQTWALRMLRGLPVHGMLAASQGERAAEQIAMALDSLFVAYTRNARLEKSDAIREAIHGLFKQLDDPSSYDPRKFAQQLGIIGGLLK